MAICRELEEKHGLIPAVKGQEQTAGAEARIVDYPRGNVKQQVSSAVRYVLQNYRFSSPGELNTLLNLFNVSVEQVEGTARDMPYKGVVYQAMQNGETVGKPFKSSIIGKDVGFEALQKKYDNCKNYLKGKPDNIEKLKTIIADAMLHAANPHELARLLGEHEIHTIMRRAPDGRIYGITFADHRNKIVVNGSRLGKEFAAARFHELYGNIANLGKASVVSESAAAVNPDKVADATYSQVTPVAPTASPAASELLSPKEPSDIKLQTPHPNPASAALEPLALESQHISLLKESPDIQQQSQLMAPEPQELPVDYEPTPQVQLFDKAEPQAPPLDQSESQEQWSWPDENTVWHDHDYVFGLPPEVFWQWQDSKEHSSEECNPKEFSPNMSDPLSVLLETAAGPEAYDESEELQRRRRKRRNRNLLK